MSVTAYIALGSNLGDRVESLDRALELLRTCSGIAVTKVSCYRETEPVGGPPGQQYYFNAAAEIVTSLEPDRLLQVLLDVERQLGRVRTQQYGPRTIDLDLLLYGDVVCQGSELCLPHPRMHERSFVLKPLAEIAPDVIHPLLDRSIQELLKILDTEDELDEIWKDLQELSKQRAEIRRAWQQAQSKEDRVRCHAQEMIFERKAKEFFAEIEHTQDHLARLRGRPGFAKAPRMVKYFLDRDLVGSRALVTGSTSGIGQAIALELAAAGVDVIMHGRRLTPSTTVLLRLKNFSVRSERILADLREPAECERLVRTAWDLWNGLDIWINNAGANTLTGEAADWPFERKLEELLAVDLKATMFLSREVGERMKKRGRGVILNIGWDQAETGMEGDSGQLFGTTKAAVMAFTKSLAATLAPEVRVNCLAPGWIRTEWGAGASERWQERVRKETLLQRWGTPEDVAATAHWLVSPAAAFITGQVIRVNGGAVR